MAHISKASTKMVRNTVKGTSSGTIKVHTRVSGSRMRCRDMESTFGMIRESMRVGGRAIR
jgi:hypothetical protein